MSNKFKAIVIDQKSEKFSREIKELETNFLDQGDIDSFERKELKTLYSRWQLLVQLAGVLGLKAEEKGQIHSRIKIPPRTINENEIKKAIEARKDAKSKRDFAKADQIRDELKSLGINLIDKPGGITDWTI